MRPRAWGDLPTLAASMLPSGRNSARRRASASALGDEMGALGGHGLGRNASATGRSTTAACSVAQITEWSKALLATSSRAAWARSALRST